MKRQILFTTLMFVFLFVHTHAQNASPYWSLTGNSNASSSSKLGTTNAVPLRLFTNNTLRLVIADDGKVGIGTTSPQQLLHVEGPTLLSLFVNTNAPGATSGAGMIGYVKGLPTAADQRLGYFLVGSRGGGQNNYNAAGMVGYTAGAWTAGSSYPAYLAFETTPSGSATRVERMRVNSMGNIGIGTAHPSQRLHVVGNAYLTGKIGIGISAPAYPLDITNSSSIRSVNVLNPTTGEEIDRYGVYASSVVSDFYGYGVYGTGGYAGLYGFGQGGANQFSTIGVYGYASGTSSVGSRYGVYGFATGGSFNAAGYFSGPVYGYSFNTVSDRKFKTNITAIKTPMALLMKLRPAVYEFKTAEYAGMGLPKGKQIGLIADEVKQVLPELISEAVQPAQYGKDKTEVLQPEVKYESVNYIQLIPVLIAAVQEQQGRIETLGKENGELKQQNENLEIRLQKLEALLTKNNASVGETTAAYLNNPVPNPSNGNAIVRYGLPDGITSARLTLTNAKGQRLKEFSLNGRGIGQVNIITASLSAGTYTCTLWVDGQQAASKQLVIAR